MSQTRNVKLFHCVFGEFRPRSGFPVVWHNITHPYGDKKQYSERKRQLGSNNTGYAMLGHGMSGSWLSTNVVKCKILAQNTICVRVFSDVRPITATRCLFPRDTLTVSRGTAFDSNVAFARFRTGSHPPPQSTYINTVFSWCVNTH